MEKVKKWEEDNILSRDFKIQRRDVNENVA